MRDPVRKFMESDADFPHYTVNRMDLPLILYGRTENWMKITHLALAVLLAGGGSLWAQKVTYNYDKQADFSKYKTYQWVPLEQGKIQNGILEKNVIQVIDEQLVAKGLRRVDSNPHLLVAYQAGTQKEKQLNTISTGGWGYGPGWGPGMTTATTSTVTIGTLVVSIGDASTKSLIWRGQGTDTINPSKDPEKNYKKLQKAAAKILKDFPPKWKS